MITVTYPVPGGRQRGAVLHTEADLALLLLADGVTRIWIGWAFLRMVRESPTPRLEPPQGRPASETPPQ
jgi:hypothetical protein